MSVGTTSTCPPTARQSCATSSSAWRLREASTNLARRDRALLARIVLIVEAGALAAIDAFEDPGLCTAVGPPASLRPSAMSGPTAATRVSVAGA